MILPEFSKKITEVFEQLSPRQLLLLAFTASCLVALLLYFYLTGLENSRTAAVQQVTQIVVAAVDIPEKTAIQAQMLKTVQVPIELLQSDVITDARVAEGKITKTKIFQGDPITAKKWFANNKMDSFVGAIPDDKRAISIPISDTTGISGFARAGDYVDVMLISDKTYRDAITGNMILQNIQLLALNKTSSPGDDLKEAKKESMATATLAVTPQEAIRLAVAQMQGTVYLLLRPFSPINSFSLTTEVIASRPGQVAQQTAPPAAVQPSRNDAVQPTAPPSAVFQQGPPIKKFQESISVIRGTSVNTVEVR